VNPNASKLSTKRESLVRRLLVICAVTVAVLVGFAGAGKHPPIAHAAGSNPGNLTLYSADSAPGCPLGPAYTFCDQPPGTTGAAEIFYINNSAAVIGLGVSFAPIPGLSANFAAGDFTIANNTCTGDLGANQQCSIGVAFSPTVAGLRAAALTVTDAAGDTLAVNIEGTGNNLAMTSPVSSPCFRDNAFTFCGQPVVSASGAEDFTVTAGSAGATAVSVTLTAIPGLESEFASNDFTITANGCGALAAGASCTVSVEFTPTAVGLRSAALTATDSEGDSTTLYLAGYGNNGRGGTTQAGGLSYGFNEPGPNPATCARVNYFGYCNEPAGGASSETKTFTLNNVSGAQITGLVIPAGSVTPNSSTPPDFTVQSTTCTSTLDANASCQITVQFTPQKTGLRQGAVVVTDDQGDVAAVNLADVGDDYNLALESGQTQQLTIVAGGTATFGAQVTPDSVFGMNREQVTFVCPTNLPANTSCTITPCPATVTPGTPTSFQIALVTSSATDVAPVLPELSGCTSYGFAGIFTPGLRGPEPPSAPVPAWRARRWRFPAPFFGAWALTALILALACGFGALAWADTGRRRSVRLALIATGLALLVLPSCHHKKATVTSATPAGLTTMTIHGNALDAEGNPVNAARSMRITLDVTAK
jgi:hypothetical protein